MREMKELCENKMIYGQFVQEIPETTNRKDKCNWLRKAGLKLEMEAKLCAAQKQAIQTNYVKHKMNIKQPNHHLRECVTRKVGLYLTL